jgi:hypothetical protein
VSWPPKKVESVTPANGMSAAPVSAPGSFSTSVPSYYTVMSRVARSTRCSTMCQFQSACHRRRNRLAPPAPEHTMTASLATDIAHGEP